jgi:hypothetical protein
MVRAVSSTAICCHRRDTATERAALAQLDRSAYSSRLGCGDLSQLRYTPSWRDPGGRLLVLPRWQRKRKFGGAARWGGDESGPRPGARTLAIAGQFDHVMLSPTGIDEWGTRVIEAGEDVVRDSSFDDTRKARWLQDLKMGYSGPVAGVILHLLPNLQQLELRNPLIYLSDTFGPLFGEYCREFSGKDYIHRHYPVTRPPRAGTLEGMGSALGLQYLETLKLSTLFHPNLYGLTCLPRIKDLNLTLKTYNGGPDTQTPYTPDRRIEMQHIETLRVDLRIHSVGFKPFATLVALTDVMPCLTNTRKVHFYAEAPDYNHNGDFGSHYFSESDWNCYEDSYERWSYHELVATLGPLCDQIEDLQLPGGFWSLITETAWEPVDLRHLTKLQKLTVPKAAIMGAAARPRHRIGAKGTMDAGS